MGWKVVHVEGSRYSKTDMITVPVSGHDHTRLVDAAREKQEAGLDQDPCVQIVFDVRPVSREEAGYRSKLR